MPTKEELAPRRLIFVDHDVETRETQRAGHRKQERRDPAEVFGRVQVGHIQHQRRRDAEVDEVGQRIEFGAEARSAFQRPRDSPVETVEHGCGGDRAHRPFDRPSIAKRIAVKPRPSANSVIRLGIKSLSGTARRPRRRAVAASAIGALGGRPASFTLQLR